MKYLFTVLVLLTSFTVFAQHKDKEQMQHPDQNEVQETAREFIKLLLIEEYDDAKKISMPTTAEMLTKLKEGMDMSEKERTEMRKEMAELRKAQITFSNFIFKEKYNNIECDASFIFSTKPNKTEEIGLSKVKGKWLVDMTRANYEVAEDAAIEAVEEAADAAEEFIEDIEIVEEIMDTKE